MCISQPLSGRLSKDVVRTPNDSQSSISTSDPTRKYTTTNSTSPKTKSDKAFEGLTTNICQDSDKAGQKQGKV